ncbi:MAG: proline--tRNA ligase [Acidiferrobacteraceae bacterium]|nr:proline--tRNA ligase [Acidiferrobacteraceae bacterium]|tara:strand:- start:437 stop:2149 length:1713 start_codon:yes stop_codon:yes gene_type:complete
MRSSKFLLATLKETPSDAEIISHKLMLRAGMIRRVSAGIYDWLPLGLRVLRRIEKIIRQEMDSSGAQEVLLPSVQPYELWHESGRWDNYGPELLRFQDRHKRDYCYGPTHEEIITALAKTEIKSYRQLPLNLYQIQTKFRDEIRPRFGVMRAREFIMKDAYSFDFSPEGMAKSYQLMYEAYQKIFSRLGLEAQAVDADSGSIGGNFSHEFHVIANSGEDGIAFCPEANYSANVEKVDLPPSAEKCAKATQPMKEVTTPNSNTIDNLCDLLEIEPQNTLKTLLVEGINNMPVALLIRGDHELNAVKAERLPEVAKPLKMCSTEYVRELLDLELGTIGPVGLDIEIIADHTALLLSDFICGANKKDVHLQNVNWERDLPTPRSADLRKATDGDPCPIDETKTIRVRRGIEVGHVFQLGNKYSKSMEATVLDDNGESIFLYMGCYGIGVTRIVAAAIEQNHDENGIIWPNPIAPFDICIVPIGADKSDQVSNTANDLYRELSEAKFEVLIDDRNERPGVKFAEMDLIGIPHRLVISERGLSNGTVEYRNRRTGESSDYALIDIVETLATIKKL